MSTQTQTHKFKGALAALSWLRQNGFKEGVNLSDAWTGADRTAYVVDVRPGLVVVSVSGADTGHEPTDCWRGKGQYSFRNWTFTHTCPVCDRKGKFNQNFLGRRTVVCDGIKFHKVSK
jgi:hypothetical protein